MTYQGVRARPTPDETGEFLEVSTDGKENLAFEGKALAGRNLLDFDRLDQ